MKKIKMYVNLEELNEEERKIGKISYGKLIKKISNNVWLFNKVPEICQNDFEFVIGNDYDEESNI